MIDLGRLSYEEKETIEEFRKRMEKEIDDPFMLEDVTLYYRFLKARDFKIDKAEKMLRKHIIWRKAKQVNNIRENFVPKEVFLNLIEPSDLGNDKKGDPVVYCAMGRIEGRDVVQCVQINNYLDHWIWYAEKKLKQYRKDAKMRDKTSKIHLQMSFIFDLDQLTFSNATSKISMEVMLEIMQLLLDNYPESLSNIYIINAPRYYVIPFSILKTVMSNAMLQKISFFGKDGWKDALLNSIDADILPAFLGGNRSDPSGDPMWRNFIAFSPIPVELYRLPDDERYFKDKTQIQKVSIPKNSKKEIDVDVTEEGSVIQFEFLVKEKDIGIGLFRKDLELFEILPVLRYYTVDGTTTISYKTKIAGKYIILFDNTFSWIRSKEVEYTVKVVKTEN